MSLALLRYGAAELRPAIALHATALPLPDVPYVPDDRYVSTDGDPLVRPPDCMT